MTESEIEDFSNSSYVHMITSYYGHILPLVPVKIRYIDKSNPKIHYIYLSLIRRKFDKATELVYEYTYYTVKAWIGDNNTVHLMQPLPHENEVKLNLDELFSVTPAQEDTDELTRASIIGELFEEGSEEDDTF